MIDLEILRNLMAEIRENDDLLDSLSPNQFNTKLKLVDAVNKLDFLNKKVGLFDRKIACISPNVVPILPEIVTLGLIVGPNITFCST